MLHLKELREKSKRTQKVTAELIGVHINVWCRWEHGDYNPQWEQAIQIAEYFGVSLDYLAGLTDNPKRY